MCEGFTRVSLPPETSDLLTVIASWGTNYRFLCMPFGMSDGPLRFHDSYLRVINEACRRAGLPTTEVAVARLHWIDDLLSGSRKEAAELHLRFWDCLLGLMEELGWALKLSKCSWLQPTGKFVGVERRRGSAY